jgi:hypothetical protein
VLVGLVEGAIEIISGPNQPKEGPLDSLVKQLAGVTREEPAHQIMIAIDTNRPNRNPRMVEGWRSSGSMRIGDGKERRWLDPSPGSHRRCHAMCG